MNYLAHHGVKGQKWGVRRYQNKDGTLTNIGKTRMDAKNVEKANKYLKSNALWKRRYETLKIKVHYNIFWLQLLV